MGNEVVDWFAKIGRFAADIQHITEVRALTSRTAELTAELGVSCLSANLISHRARRVTPGILFGQDWKPWSDHYQRNGFYKHDPALRMLSAPSLPFTWSEAAARFSSSAGARVIDACLDFTGCREGLVVPVSEPDGAVLTAAFCGAALDTSPAARMAFHAIGSAYVARGRELMLGLCYNPVCPLTPRELQCLEWVKEGKTDIEIGMILGMSPRTAHNHVEAAKRKLGASKRLQAMQTAYRQGWII